MAGGRRFFITDDHHGTNSTVPNWECARERDTTQPPALHDYLLGPADKSGAFFTEPVGCEPARSGAADLALRRPKGAAGVRPVRTIAGVRVGNARRLQPSITNCLAPATLRSEHPLGALCTLPAGASAP